jgi:hypothetical protein
MHAGSDEAGASPGPTNGGAIPLSTIECYMTLAGFVDGLAANLSKRTVSELRRR